MLKTLFLLYLTARVSLPPGNETPKFASENQQRHTGSLQFETSSKNPDSRQKQQLDSRSIDANALDDLIDKGIIIF